MQKLIRFMVSFTSCSSSFLQLESSCDERQAVSESAEREDADQKTGLVLGTNLEGNDCVERVLKVSMAHAAHRANGHRCRTAGEDR